MNLKHQKVRLNERIKIFENIKLCHFEFTYAEYKYKFDLEGKSAEN